MPFVNATLCAKPSPGLTERVVLLLTDLTAKVLGKERERTTVAVQYVPEEQWGRGGAIPARGFYVEVKITSGTNSRDDKSRYVREVNHGLQMLLAGSAGYVAWMKSRRIPGATRARRRSFATRGTASRSRSRNYTCNRNSAAARHFRHPHAALLGNAREPDRALLRQFHHRYRHA